MANWGSLDDIKRGRYEQGTWGGGEYSIDELRSKFGLGSKATGGENDLYGHNSDGSKVFIGSVNEGGLRSNADLISAHSAQKHPEEADHTGGELSSIGDVKGALLNLWNAGDTPETAPVIEFDPKEMEMSPEYAHARARAGQFREDRISGRSAAEVFGGESTNFLEDYKMRLGEKLENGNYKPNPKYDEG